LPGSAVVVRIMVSGENLMCMAFASAAPIDDGRDVAAAVAHVQFP